jgi:hypothetical protein
MLAPRNVRRCEICCLSVMCQDRIAAEISRQHKLTDSPCGLSTTRKRGNERPTTNIRSGCILKVLGHRQNAVLGERSSHGATLSCLCVEVDLYSGAQPMVRGSRYQSRLIYYCAAHTDEAMQDLGY